MKYILKQKKGKFYLILLMGAMKNEAPTESVDK